jgi:hypothetical protein
VSFILMQKSGCRLDCLPYRRPAAGPDVDRVGDQDDYAFPVALGHHPVVAVQPHEVRGERDRDEEAALFVQEVLQR